MTSGNRKQKFKERNGRGLVSQITRATSALLSTLSLILKAVGSQGEFLSQKETLPNVQCVRFIQKDPSDYRGERLWRGEWGEWGA